MKDKVPAGQRHMTKSAGKVSHSGTQGQGGRGGRGRGTMGMGSKGCAVNGAMGKNQSTRSG